MNSRERVIRTLNFDNPDRIPLDLGILPATYLKYGKLFEDIYKKYEMDIIGFNGPMDLGFYPEFFREGRYIDSWGSEWVNLHVGIIGEVKKAILADSSIEEINRYMSPKDDFSKEWANYCSVLGGKIYQARKEGKFLLGGWISVFERIQFLRGTENVYCDLAENNEEIYKITGIVMDFYKDYLKAWLDTDVDAIVFGDDWGSQRGLLISLDMWKRFFKPLYKELFDMVKGKEKYIFFHSDGNILDLYEEFIKMGVNAINSQLWCMGIEKVAERFAGKITFWGEVCRQSILPYGKPEEVTEAVRKMKEYLFVNYGGLIGHCDIGEDVPLMNIEAALGSWN